jgi:spermidine synthase
MILIADQKGIIGMSELKELFNKYGCDKAAKHQYHKIYSKYFAPVADKKLNILEIGVFHGASTRAFLDYMPNAHMYGVDIFSRLQPEELGDLNTNDRFTYMKGDSTKKGWNKALTDAAWPKFDFIIDDGKHTPKANRQTYENFKHMLKEGGTYFIEDVFRIDTFGFAEWENKWIKSRPSDYNKQDFAMFHDSLQGKNITVHDNVKYTGQLDSVIYAIS